MSFDLTAIRVPTPLALAIFVLLAYVFAILPRRNKVQLLSMQRELARAQMAVSELEKVVGSVHSTTAKHYARLKAFKSRVAQLDSGERDAIWHELCGEVESILAPTLQLVSEIATAQERIRFQSSYLMQFSESRTDPLTGLGNRRVLDSVLNAQVAALVRYGTPFSVAIVDIDHFKDLNDQMGHLHGDKALRDLTGLLSDSLRAVDVVARYGGDEFVIAMPQTDLAGAAMLADRLRATIEQQMSFTVSIGVASATAADSPETLFHRADAALYGAKSNGRNRVCSDPGNAAEPAPGNAEHVSPGSSGIVLDCPTDASPDMAIEDK
jgi:diguanylate cyclase